MRFSNPATRSMLLLAIFVVILTHIFSSWAANRFWLYDAQNRNLAAEFYDVHLVTAAEYQQLADPRVRELKLSDGSTIGKAPIWDEVVLPHYKPTRDGSHYVLVTTKGTAHVLSYTEEQLVSIGTLAMFGLVASFWNFKLVHRELAARAVSNGDGAARHQRDPEAIDET